MLQEQILKEFKNLNEADVLRGYNTLIGRLLKVRKVDNEIDAEKFIDETLTILLDPIQKEIFKDCYSEENKDMVCRWSIFNFFHAENYYKSDLRKAVHMAKDIHAAMPKQSKLTFNL